MDIKKSYTIMRINSNDVTEDNDLVIAEYPFTIFLDGKEFIILQCTPKSLNYLTIGYLYAEGIINQKDDIEGLEIDLKSGRAYVSTRNKDAYLYLGDKLCGRRTVTTACGKSKTILYDVMDFLGTESEKINNTLKVKHEDIIRLVSLFNKKSELFIETGGVHSAALCTKTGIILFEEDIGRHNAMDKITGYALMENIQLSNKIIVTSGRISSEIITKVIKSKVPVLVSRSAPTDLSIELARKFNLTLVGFARGNRYNVYNNFNHIISV